MLPPDIAFRPAGPGDLEALAALVNSAYRGDSSRRGWTTEADLLGGLRTAPEMLAGTIASPTSVILCCFRGPDLVGCVWLDRRADSAYLGMLTVRPDLQAAGIGRQILDRAERWVAREWSLDRIEMTVIRRRAELIAWYVRRGYADTGRRQPFPADARFGLPKVDDLEMVVLAKTLPRA